ncbi:MAG: tetratricopeptide repeat protein, partial [Myxococcota bacterium]
MANEKNSGKTPDPATKPDNFDDVEDAFFASGDASSFWETADRSDLDEESQEAATAPQDIDPLDEPGEALSTAATILVEPEDEPANNDIEAPTETPISADTGSDDNEAPPIEESPILSNDAPQDTPGAPHTHAAPDPDATSFYNPASIHPEPELIADDETEIWSGTASELATLEATTILNEPDAEVAPAEELETAPASIGGDITAITYILPSSPEGRWQEMSVALEKAAGQAKGSQRAQLLCESARILLTRAGLWEDAGQRFDAAIEAGLASSDAPKGYADVVASHGRFEDLRDILVGRGNSLKGSAAAEALQDAALVERNNLKNDSAAVQLLDQALDIRNDWFTLRLLREAHYRSKSWEDLVVVLRKMASMSTGSRSARCHVEAGRIIETELQDATAAAEEYDAALTQAPDFLDGFLARARVAGSVKDWSALSALYAAESKRTTGANAAFWMSRAARVSRDGGEDEGITADLYQQAINMCDRTLLSVHREAQAWFIETNRTEELFSALKQEAELLEGAARAATLLTLGQYQAATKDGQTSAIENLAKAVEADPSCSPAADAACGILIANDRAKEALEILENQEKGSQDAQSAAQITFRMAEITEVSLGDFAKAAKLYARAWEHDPEHPFAAAGQIRCLLETGGFETAVAIMEARTQTFGDDQRASRVWFQIGVVYRDRLNNQQSAQAAFQRAIDLSPTQPAAIDAGLALIDSADHKSLGGGLALASQHLPNTKDKLEASYRAAQVYLDGCGDMAASKTLLHRCLELDPTCGPAVSLLRKVANQTGDWQAVYDLRRIEAGSATNAEERRWHLLAAAEATTHIDGIDPQTVALEVLDEDKTHPGALAVLERAAIQRRDSHRLIGVYRKMRNLTQDPAEETGIAVRLVDLSQDVGNDQLTLQCINKVLEAPSGVRPYGALARIAVSLESWSLAEAALHADGDTIGMARLFESTNDDHRRVADTWRSVLKKSPNDVEAQAGLERALSRLGTREGLADIHASLANT